MQRQQMSGKQVERQQIERERAKRQQEGQRREQLLMQQRQEMQERQEMLRRQQMQMRGEPKQEGERRKKKARRFYDYDLLVVIIFLTAFGLIMIYSSSAYNAQVSGQPSTYYMMRQGGIAVVGFIMMLIIKDRLPLFCEVCRSGGGRILHLRIPRNLYSAGNRSKR